ncbi:hypothetical protein HOK31_02180 [Candidatus Poribacteria bacterium]|nr:hypothetical protein [Candidatus Poribacteria bacterium]
MPDLSNWDYDLPWYHGSPLELTVLREGSTITQNRDLAGVFSHKPSIVAFREHGGLLGHSGEEPGFLYCVAAPATSADIHPHPTSSMEPGEEWLTDRELRLELIGPTVVCEEERLLPDEIRRLQEQWEQRKAEQA